MYIHPLGRRTPTDFDHVEKYPLRMVQPTIAKTVENTLFLPNEYIPLYDQGEEGACVGFAASWMQSIHYGPFYHAEWLYREAQLVDEWDDTPPEEGTSVRAGMDILRKVGHRAQWPCGRWGWARSQHGIRENRWARTVDEMRTAIRANTAITIGVNWYTNFDNPQQEGTHWWIGRGNIGRIRGGHAVCVYGASDHLEAFFVINSWGHDYPPVLLPYDTMARLLDEYGEATIVTQYSK